MNLSCSPFSGGFAKNGRIFGAPNHVPGEAFRRATFEKRSSVSPKADRGPSFRIAAGSPGTRSIGYGLWLVRLEPFEDGPQRLGLRRSRLRLEIDEPAQRRDQDRTFVIGKV
jgi:hypothetical protein